MHVHNQLGSGRMTEHCPLAVFLDTGCSIATYFHFAWSSASRSGPQQVGPGMWAQIEKGLTIAVQFKNTN